MTTTTRPARHWAGTHDVTVPALDGAACVGHDPRLWFLDEAHPIAAAICGRCPVRVACLTAAVQRGEADGTWGGHRLDGTTRSDRRRILRAEQGAAA